MIKIADILTPEEIAIVKRAWAIYGLGPQNTKILGEPFKAFEKKKEIA